MPDFGAPVATGINPSAGLQTLGELANVKRSMQALQTGQAVQQSAQAQASLDVRTARERQALASVHWDQFQKPDGSFDTDAVNKTAVSVAPTTGSEFASRFANMTRDSAEGKRAWLNLTNDQQQPVKNALGVWAADPNSNVNDLGNQLDTIYDNAPDSAKPAIDTIRTNTMRHLSLPDLISGGPQTPQNQKRFALAMSRSSLSAEGVSGAGGLATPATGGTYVDAQGNVQPVATSRTTGESVPAGAPLKQGVGPEARATQITLPNQQVAILNRATGQYEIVGAGKRAATTSPPPSSTSAAATSPSAPAKPPAVRGPLSAENDPARPSANAPVATQQAWEKSVADARQHVADTRTADQSYGNNMDIAKEVRRLSMSSNTGPGSPGLAHTVGFVTSRFGGSEGVTNLQTLESFLDRQAASLRAAQGLPNTNAGSEEARVIGGNIGMQGGALRAKNDYNEALAQGLHDYRQGLDRVEGFTGQPSPNAVARFKAAWAQNYSPVAYEWKLAMQRGDKASADTIARSLSAQARADMQRKGRALDALTEGRMP